MEAPGGFEPPIEVLQTSALATWRRRPLSSIGWGKGEKWSGRRDLNPRPQPWQGCTLPLSYSRSFNYNLSAMQMDFHYISCPLFVKRYFLMNLLSVPSTSRRMFSRCRMIVMIPAVVAT